MRYSIISHNQHDHNSYKLKEDAGELDVFNNHLKKLHIAKCYWGSITSLYMKGMNTELQENQAY